MKAASPVLQIAEPVPVQPQAVLDIDWHPDGNRLASVQANGSVTVIDVSSGQVLFNYSPAAPFSPRVYAQVEWDRTGDRLAAGIGEWIYVWRVQDYQLLDSFIAGSADGVARTEWGTFPESVAALVWSNNNAQLAASLRSGILVIRTPLSGQTTLQRVVGNAPSSIFWSPDDVELLYGVAAFRAGDGELRFRTTANALPGAEYGQIIAVDVSPTNALVAQAVFEGGIIISWVDTGAMSQYFELTTNPVENYATDVSWNTSGSLLAAVSSAGGVYVIETSTQLLDQVSTVIGSLSSVDWHPTENRFAVGGVTSDGSALIETLFPPGNLTGAITLPSRTRGTAAYAVPLSVKLADSGGALVSEHSPTTDVNGYFTLQDLPQGTYGVWLKHAQSLAVMPSVTLDAPSVSLDFGTLAMGDADDSNQINMVDFSILGAAFGTSDGQPGYNADADFTGDSSVGISDFSLLAYSFGLVGVPPPAGGSGAPELRVLETIPPELASARLRFLTNNGSVSTRVGAAFSVTLAAGNSTVGQGSVISLLDGAEVHLTFDPTKLQVDEALAGLTPGTTLPTVLKNVYDNSAGTIDFAAGTLNAAAQGQFTLVTIRFRALASTGSGVTLVQASSAPYRENVLTLDGAAITPTLTPLSVKIR
ncbi:MAG: hypothetical protein JNL42_19355 [Anaerolineae bacterium]|nr:hypothetical protein [Anaerolineae bacterium]